MDDQVRSQADEAAGPGGMSGDAAGAVGARWDYEFEVEAADDADPAMVLLMGVLDWPSVTLTLGVAQFAAFKKGLERHGIELARVTRRRHPEATPWRGDDERGKNDDR